MIVGVSAYWQTVFTGAVIVLAVLLNSIQYGSRGAEQASRDGRARRPIELAAGGDTNREETTHAENGKRLLLAAVAVTPLLTGSAWADG